MAKKEAHIDPLSGETLAPAIPAATLVLARNREHAAPELLMVERSREMVFAGGAAVFPGGRIDPADYRFAEQIWDGDELEEGAARIAAIRETLEETGILAGASETPSGRELQDARDALHAGREFSEICAAHNWVPDLAALVPWARWRPPFAEKRIFDTRFYVADATHAVGEATVDETENRHLFWAAAADVLENADAGRLKIIFPTRRNLERLAQFGDFDAVVGHAQHYPVQTVVPFVADRNGAAHLCIAEDLGYPVTAELLKGARRG